MSIAPFSALGFSLEIHRFLFDPSFIILFLYLSSLCLFLIYSSKIMFPKMLLLRLSLS